MQETNLRFPLPLQPSFSSCVKQALAVCLLLACAAKSMSQEAPRSPEKVFADTCVYCHGHFIAPGLPVIQDIRGRNLPPELIKQYVRNGMGVMPAFRHTEISDRELTALANWIQTSKAPPPPPMPPMAMPAGGKPREN